MHTKTHKTLPQAADKNIIADFENFDKAAQFLNAALSGKYRVIIYGGAIRGGKTFNSLAVLVLLHKIYPQSRSVITRDSWKTMKRAVYPSARKAIPENFIAKFNASDYYWKFANGSEMFFYPENYDADKELKQWDGLEVNFILLEQAEGLHHICFDKALERVGSFMVPNGKQPPPLLLVTMNPNSTWARQFHDQWRNGELPKNWLYIPARIDDNPHIDASYKESLQELKKSNPAKYKRYVEGDWDVEEDADDRLVQNAAIDDIFTNSFVPEGKRIITSDIAFEGSDRFVIGHWSGWRLENITVIPKSKGNEVVDELQRAAYINHTGNSDIGFDADGVGSGIGGFIPSAREFKSRKPPIINDGYECAKDEAAWLLAQKINSKELYIHPRCLAFRDEFKAELKVLRRKPQSQYNSKLALIKKDDQKTYLRGKSPDFLDMLIIRAWMELLEGKDATYYHNFAPETHLKTVSYQQGLSLHIGIQLNNRFHINAVVCQVEANQINAIQEFTLQSPRNNIKCLTDDILHWLGIKSEFSTIQNTGCFYYARPLSESEADEDAYAASIQQLNTSLKPIKAKQKALMIAKKHRLTRPITNKVLNGETYTLRINPDTCPNLTRDFRMVKESKSGDKTDDPTGNTNNPTDALENFLSIYIK